MARRKHDPLPPPLRFMRWAFLFWCVWMLSIIVSGLEVAW